MEKVIHRSASRGFADHGWIKSYYTFSFENYYDPRRIHFGVLRIINDDTIEGGEGFRSHPHDNMEIVILPLKGAIEHGDNMGNISVVGVGDVQVMSAGTGVFHNEYNRSQGEPAEILRMWIYPKEYDVTPELNKVEYGSPEPNVLKLIVAPACVDSGNNVARIHQDAWFYIGELKAGAEVTHSVHSERKGTYLFVIEGSVSVGDTELGRRDGFGIWDVENFSIRAETDARILLIEVPLRR